MPPHEVGADNVLIPVLPPLVRLCYSDELKSGRLGAF